MTSHPTHPKLSDQLCRLLAAGTEHLFNFFLSAHMSPEPLADENVPDRLRRPREYTFELREHGLTEDIRTVHTLWSLRRSTEHVSTFFENPGQLRFVLLYIVGR